MTKNTIIFWLILVLLASTCGGKKEEETAASNDAPVLQSVTLLPLSPNVRSEITARILASDKEGDPITYQVKWFVNDEEIGEGMSLTYPGIKKRDKIFAEVTPYDGKTYGKAMKSGEVTIGGMAPRIVSVSVIPEMVYVTTPQITLNALFEDADQEEIELVVHWLVHDEVLNNTSNVLQLSSLGLKKNEVITGTAFADDGDDRSEPFPFEITIANSPPVFRVKIDSVKCATDSVNYTLPIFDPDGDPLSFELLDAPTGITIDKENGIISGTAGQTEVFEVLVRATDSDGAYLDAKFTLAAK